MARQQKRKYPKKKAKRVRTPNDTHHLFWTSKKWGFGDLASLRRYWYCKISIPRKTLHWHIHENIAIIPTPSDDNAKQVLTVLRQLTIAGAIRDSDKIERRLEVLIALFDENEPKTTDALKRQLEVVREFYDKPSE